MNPEPPPVPEHEMDQFLAGAEMVGHLGAFNFEFRLSEGEDVGGPAVFLSVATFTRPSVRWDAGAGVTPLISMIRLLDQLMDGGQCTHCHRPTGVVHGPPWEMPWSSVCWYRYDPAVKKYRRGCEGGTKRVRFGDSPGTTREEVGTTEDGRPIVRETYRFNG